MESFLNQVRRLASLLTQLATMSKADLMGRRAVSAIDREAAADLIRQHVQFGFDKPSRIGRIVEESHDAPSVTAGDRAWIESEIRRQLKEKRRGEDLWPEETNWDRLNKVFVALRRKGILALHNAGFTESDGIALVHETMRDQPSPKPWQGYCFYHQQDIEYALEGKELLLSHGAMGDSSEVAPYIVEMLGKAGFKAEWGGDRERIRIRNFAWQKRSPRASKGSSKRPPRSSGTKGS